MTVLLIPVGHDVGPFFARTGDEVPRSFDVRYGDGAFNFNPLEYLLWELAHGDIVQAVAGEGCTRKYLVETAREHHIAEPEPVLAAVLSVGALVELDTADPVACHRFAEAHRIVPLTRGLGNSPNAPVLFGIPTAGTQQLAVTADTYYLWMYGHLQHSLWRACVQRETGRVTPGSGLAKKSEDATAVLNEMISALPQLMAGRSVYIDRSI
ncbi:MAG: hypothetical protein DLM55_12785 [Acidimicrobiales bacterium]|nr:MAG: hypothetical protein DLM55_12785 [Acidimicrobiales bacterium]